MPIVRLSAICSILIAVTQGLSAQDNPKPILADEFGEIYCDEFLGRTDAFFAELMQHPNDLGYILIFSGGRNPKGFKKFVSTNVYMRQFDATRLRIIVTSDPSKSNGQFWRVPPGAEPPNVTEILEPDPDFTAPFVVGHISGENVCPSFNPQLYAEMIKKHPGSTGRIVIYGPDWLQRKQFADSEAEDFENRFGLPKDRIKFYFVHRPGNFLTDAEYWFIPAKKK